MPRISRIGLAAFLLAALAFRIVFIGHDLRELVTHGPLYDDSFYSFEIARNIARGLGSTFDGVTPTNGYQPLYVFLLVPVYAVLGADPEVPIYVALVLSAICNVLTGWILFRLLRAYSSERAAFFGLALWAFGPAIVRQSVNGLETSLAMLLVAAATDYYVRVYRRADRPTRRQALTLGALLGLAVFARVDALLFAAALGADALARRRTRDPRTLAWAVVAAALVLLPWCVGSRAVFGTMLPESGRATRYLSEAYAPHVHPDLSTASFASGPPMKYLVDNLSLSFLQLGTSPVLHVFTRGLERGLEVVHLDRAARLYAVGAFLGITMFVVLLFARRSARRGRPLPADFGFLLLYSVLMVCAYSFVVFGQIFYSRYYYPVFFFSIVLGAVGFDALVGLLRSPRAQRVVAIGATAAYAVVLGYMSLNRVQNGNYRFLHVVDWIAARTEPDARIGVFNSGAIGYFSDRRIVNLDGKVNAAAREALRTASLCRYIEAEHLDYVIDHQWIVEELLLSHTRDPGCIGFERVEGDGGLGVPGWAAYRVVHDVAAHGGPAGAGLAHRRH